MSVTRCQERGIPGSIGVGTHRCTYRASWRHTHIRSGISWVKCGTHIRPYVNNPKYKVEQL